MNIEFDLQTHLMNMENRIGDKIDEVHVDVRAHTKRLGYLETSQAKIIVQVRWLWSIGAGFFSTALLWIGTQLFPPSS